MNENLLVKKVMKWLLAGNSRSDILELIKDHSGLQLTDKECNELLQQGKNLLSDSFSTNLEKIVTSHVNIYETIFLYFHSLDDTDGMNRAMSQKERLVGLTGRSTISLTRKTDINIKKSVFYDLEKLEIASRNRLLYLVNKVKIEKNSNNPILISG